MPEACFERESVVFLRELDNLIIFLFTLRPDPRGGAILLRSDLHEMHDLYEWSKLTCCRFGFLELRRLNCSTSGSGGRYFDHRVEGM